MAKLFNCLIVLLIATAVWALSIDSQSLYQLKIDNRVSGEVSVSKDSGQTWQKLGEVIRPVNKVNEAGYAAAQFIEPGVVAATAVNAIHIKVGAKDHSKKIFSLLPLEFNQRPQAYNSYLDQSTSIQTNIPAGQQLFGGAYSPFVGSVVSVVRSGQGAKQLDQSFGPKIGDIFYISVSQPVKYPLAIVFENCFGGKITAQYPSGDEEIVGEVLRPVVGIGRFLGSQYAGPGRIRANHGGVIDVSVSPLGEIGGFQIVPANHASDLMYVKTSTQWMVIGPPSVEGASFEGTAPFFKYFIKPAYVESCLTEADWQEKLLSRFLVEVQYQGQKSWQAMPIFAINKFYLNKDLPVWSDTALKNVTAIRIVFPISQLP